MDLSINMVDVLFSLVIAIITAIITARLALNHFYIKEMWLRKESKYSEIINELSNMLLFREKEINSILYAEEVPDDSYKQLALNNKKSMLMLQKIKYSTGFIINPAVNDVIDKMMQDFDFDDCGDYFCYVESTYSVISNAISQIIDIAKKDLKK